jgi:hypothetical protein
LDYEKLPYSIFLYTSKYLKVPVGVFAAVVAKSPGLGLNTNRRTGVTGSSNTADHCGSTSSSSLEPPIPAPPPLQKADTDESKLAKVEEHLKPEEIGRINTFASHGGLQVQLPGAKKPETPFRGTNATDHCRNNFKPRDVSTAGAEIRRKAEGENDRIRREKADWGRGKMGSNSGPPARNPKSSLVRGAESHGRRVEIVDEDSPQVDGNGNNDSDDRGVRIQLADISVAEVKAIDATAGINNRTDNIHGDPNESEVSTLRLMSGRTVALPSRSELSGSNAQTVTTSASSSSSNNTSSDTVVAKKPPPGPPVPSGGFVITIGRSGGHEDPSKSTEKPKPPPLSHTKDGDTNNWRAYRNEAGEDRNHSFGRSRDGQIDRSQGQGRGTGGVYRPPGAIAVAADRSQGQGRGTGGVYRPPGAIAAATAAPVERTNNRWGANSTSSSVKASDVKAAKQAIPLPPQKSAETSTSGGASASTANAMSASTEVDEDVPDFSTLKPRKVKNWADDDSNSDDD